MAKPTEAAIHFPGESAEYRAARNKLLDAEMALRRQTESVAALRRTLPAGGEVPEDYVFQEASKPVRMSELFAPGKDTLILYNFMFGPNMETACPSCTSILDGLDGESPHVSQRVNFAIVAKSPIERIRAFAKQRHWENLRLLSSGENTYNRDYHGELPNGEQMPMLNVFTRHNGTITHFWASEMLHAPSDPGQDPRHVDFVWPIWSLFDVTPDGRGEKWSPRLSY
jgi:predicted dithiol-disulfide oxidoreductase (DUF899 family)